MIRGGHGTSPTRVEVGGGVDEWHACVMVFVASTVTSEVIMVFFPGITVRDVATDATVSVTVTYFVKVDRAVAVAVRLTSDLEMAVTVSKTVAVVTIVSNSVVTITFVRVSVTVYGVSMYEV